MNIYAIFYEGESYNEAGEVTEVILDGNLPNQNYEHPSMVALALISNPHETDDWEAFDIPFDYQRYGKEIDETKLAKGKYKLSNHFCIQQERCNFRGCARKYPFSG